MLLLPWLLFLQNQSQVKYLLPHRLQKTVSAWPAQPQWHLQASTNVPTVLPETTSTSLNHPQVPVLVVHRMVILMRHLMHADKTSIEGIMQIGIEGARMTIAVGMTAIGGETGDRTIREGPGMNTTVAGIEIGTVILIEGDHHRLEGGTLMTEIDDNGGLVLHHHVELVSLFLSSLRYPTHQSSLLLGPSDAGRRRSPMSPRRRPPSPTRSRATSRSKSRAPSPSSKVRLGSHSIASPNSLRKAPVSPRRRRSYSRSRSRTPPPRRRSFSRSPRRRSSPVDKRERYPSPSVPIDSPSRSHKTSRHQTPRRSRSRSRSPAPSPVKTEVAEDIVMSSVDTSAMEMGKAKEEEDHLPPSATATKIEADPDTKMNNPTPNIPTGPRNAGGPPREPPRGPRGYAQQPPPPTGPASRPTPTQPRNAVAQSTASGSTPARTEVALSPKTEPEAILPVIPPYRIKTTLQPEQDSEVRPSLLLISLWYSPLPQIARLRAQRANLTSEYANVSKATRRALHELEMASFDLRTAEKRRKLADTHLDMARMGVLGIDYVPNIV